MNHERESGQAWRWGVLVAAFALAGWVLWFGAHHPVAHVQSVSVEDAP